MTSSKEKYLKKLFLHFVMNHKKIYCQRILCHIATFSTSVEDDDGRKLNWLSLNLSAIICLPCPGTPSMATATFTSSSDSPSLVMMVTTMMMAANPPFLSLSLSQTSQSWISMTASINYRSIPTVQCGHQLWKM